MRDKLIGLSWAVIDYDGSPDKKNNGFWNLSPEHTMYGNATFLREFRLMPLEPQLRKPIEAKWSFKMVDMKRRLVAFEDESVGAGDELALGLWRWDGLVGPVSDPPVQVGGRVCGGAVCRGAGRQVAAVEDLGCDGAVEGLSGQGRSVGGYPPSLPVFAKSWKQTS